MGHSWHSDDIAFVAPSTDVAMHFVVFTGPKTVTDALRAACDQMFSTSVEFSVVDHPSHAAIDQLLVDPHPHRSIVSQDRASAQREFGPLEALIGLRALRNRECQTAANSQDGARFSLHKGSLRITI